MAPLNPTINKARPHRRFKQGEGALFAKMPRGLGMSDDNVIFGLGSNTHGGAAAGQVLTANVSREMTLRDLYIATGNVRGRVSAISAAGDALQQGKSFPIEGFSPLCQSRPQFDIPVYTGTVSVTYDIDAAAVVDAGFNID